MPGRVWWDCDGGWRERHRLGGREDDGLEGSDDPGTVVLPL